MFAENVVISICRHFAFIIHLSISYKSLELSLFAVGLIYLIRRKIMINEE